jgi:hypothetical protein
MTKPSTHHDGSGAFTAFQPMALFAGPNFDAFGRAAETWTKACLAWQEGLMQSTTARFQRDSQAGQAMTACKSWEDVAKLQQEWTASTVQACIDDASRFTQLASKFAASAAPVSEPIRQVPVEVSR